jgi:uncharacterized alkaline shock family protein YloU
VEGHAVINADILARYAADAAREVPGVRALVPSQLHRHRGVRILEDGARVELHVAAEWGTHLPTVGREIEQRVREYLRSMANAEVAAVDVVVDEVLR